VALQSINLPKASAGTDGVAKAADVDALFRQYSGFVATFALRLLGRDSDVEDLVQDVFLDTVRGIHTLRDPASTKAWLGTLTVRAARRCLRRKRLRRVFLRTIRPIDVAELIAPAATAQQRLELSRTYEALETLPANHRLAWVLRVIEGSSLAEVAEQCECSLATAKRHIALAHRHLKKAASGE
jgi:RNA polymerase sigma-70 factor (ECF subfamily)